MPILKSLPAKTVALSAASLVVGAMVGAAALAGQTHMLAARDALLTARQELSQAKHNKGGHREAAISLINKALDQVNAGIRAGH